MHAADTIAGGDVVTPHRPPLQLTRAEGPATPGQSDPVRRREGGRDSRGERSKGGRGRWVRRSTRQWPRSTGISHRELDGGPTTPLPQGTHAGGPAGHAVKGEDGLQLATCIQASRVAGRGRVDRPGRTADRDPALGCNQAKGTLANCLQRVAVALDAGPIAGVLLVRLLNLGLLRRSIAGKGRTEDKVTTEADGMEVEQVPAPGQGRRDASPTDITRRRDALAAADNCALRSDMQLAPDGHRTATNSSEAPLEALLDCRSPPSEGGST